jgi:hypothetical protein
MRLASLGVNGNSSYANFGPGMLNTNSGVAYTGTYNMFNSNGNENEDYAAVCPVASVNCGYAIKDCIREI